MKKAEIENISYREAKKIIESNIKEMSRSFIVVGYYLKYIRDNEMYNKDGFADIWEFANQTYGIKKSTAFRWMQLNDKFSKNGNSPILHEVYQKFSKSQLQEMLYLKENQLKEIKPDMTVKEIRKVKNNESAKTDMEKKEGIVLIRRTYMEALAKYLIKIDIGWFKKDIHRRVLNVEISPKEIRERFCKTSCSWSFELESGELCRANLFEKYVQLWDKNDNCIGDFEWFYFAVSIQEMWNIVAIEEIDKLREERTVATSQQENDIGIEEPVHFTVENKLSIEGAYGATRAEIVREYLKRIYELGYVLNQEIPEIEFIAWGSSYRALLNERIIEFYDDKCLFMDVEIKRLENEYKFFYPKLETKNESQCIHRHEYSCTLDEAQKMAVGDGENCSASCCWNCENHGQCGYECNSSAHRPDATEPAEVFIESEQEPADQDIRNNKTEHQEESCAKREYPTNLSPEEKRVLEDALVYSNERLEVMGEEWKEKQPGIYIKHKTLKAAYELMLIHGAPEEKYRPDLQLELQKFKNNDKRKEFISDYKVWPVWFESKETGETHYRYNLPDDSSIVARHYIQHIEWKNEDVENEAFFLLKDGKYFRDCSTSVTSLIEHLKEIICKE